MNRRMPGLLTFGLFGLLASAACTVITPSDGTDANGGASDQSGAGGTVSSAGAPHGAGRGGSPAQAGSTARAGSTGRAGAANGGASAAGEGDAAGEGGAPDQPQCPTCKSGFCFKDGTCVDCLPSQDNCPSGTVCGATNTCVAGCKADGTSCESGVCADTKNCQSCMGDDECGAGNVCGDNRCAPKCTAAQEGTTNGCSDGHSCCSLHCVDLTTDGQHCGACGTPCGAGQFCGPAACSASGAAGAGGADGEAGACVSCHDIAIGNVCSVPQVAVVLDGADGNEAAGRAIAAAIAAQCKPAPVVRAVSQTKADALNPASGRPISGAHELLVAAGGSYYARLLVYLDSKRVSPIYWYYDGNATLEFRKAANDETVVARGFDEPNDDHDFFVIQFLREPTSGSIILNAQGFWLSGTNAATYFFSQAMLPKLSDFDKAWYIYEWKDADGDKAPDLAEITAVASGN